MADRSPAPARRRTVAPRTVLLVASLGVFMAFVDNTIVTIAFPDMLGSFAGTDLAGLSWVFNIYNIALAAMLVPAGRLADLLGRRKVFAAGIALFTIASALCAVAPTSGGLIAARALQGAGAAIIIPASLGLILHAYPGEKRTPAVALWTATGALAAGIGPSIGGLLVDLAGWRMVFLINLPLGVVAWRMAGSRLVESRAPGRRAMPDLGGALVLAVAIGMLSLAFIRSETWGLLGWQTWVVLALSAVAFADFARRCRTHPAPIVDLGLLGSRAVVVASAMTVVGGAGFFALGLTNILYLIDVWGYSPLLAGLAGTPAPFLAAGAAVLVGRLAAERDPRPWIVAGAAIWALGPLVFIERFSVEPDYLTRYLPAAAVLALGIGMALPLVGSVAVSGATGGRFAGATALNGALRQVGAALGVAILVAIIGEPSPAEIESAFRSAWIFSIACFAIVAVAGLFLGRVPAAPPDDEDELPPIPASTNALAAAATSAGALARPAPVPAPATSGPASAADVLSGVELFASLSPDALQALARRTTTVTVQAGDWLFRQGDRADAMFIVRSGRVEVVEEPDDGDAVVLREMAAGQALGEIALIRESTRTSSVRARRDASLLRIGRSDFEAMLDESPQVARALLRTLGDWLAGPRVREAGPARPTTIAVVALDATAEASRIDLALAAAMQVLGPVHRLGPDDLPSGADRGHALAERLERIEQARHQVVLSAGRLGEPWAGACIRQADRVLLVLGEPAGDGASPADAPTGADVVLLLDAARPAVAQRLDALGPRRTYRVRGAADHAAVAALARRLSGRSLGLVLSGGGARCLAQIGVIEELQAAGVQIDRVAGASMGAFIGGLLAQGLDAEEIDARVYEEFVRRSPFGDFRFPRTSLVRGERARTMLQRNMPGRIEDLPLGFFCVSVDLIAAEPLYHRRGDLAECVGASMSLPVLAPPMPKPGRLLLDGGLMDNLPSEVMAADGEGPIIGVDATEPSVRHLPGNPPPPVPTLVETIYKIMLLSESDSERRRSFADVLIRPDHDGTGILEFHMLDRLRAAGRRAAREAMERSPEVFTP